MVSVPATTEPAVSALGSDVSDLPRRFPTAAWVPIESPLLSMQLLVRVGVNNRVAIATLDTGAMGTTMSVPVAARLGLLKEDTPAGTPISAIDAHGDTILGERISLGELRIGSHRWADVDVTILGNAPDLFLVGAEVLQDVDLLIAADEGLLGLFEAGQGPLIGDDAHVVPLTTRDRQLLVVGQAPAAGGKSAEFSLLVDTGAWNTSVPALAGINAGLPADLAYNATTVGVAGEQLSRGRFVLDPLRLGPSRVPVGRVLALSSTLDAGAGLGLLGNDVLMRYRTLISWKRNELRFESLSQRATSRSRGPAGALCQQGDRAVACVSVQLVPGPVSEAAADDLDNLCLQIDVDEVYAGKTVELAITADGGDQVSVFNGGAIRAFLSVDDQGVHHCFRLWRQLEHLGLSAKTPISLRWVRTEGVYWPCDPMKTRCLSFTGPLATLPTR